MIEKSIDHRLAWLAGIIDGEGTINVIKSGTGRFQVEVSVSQVNPLPLKFITDRFGGNLYVRTIPNRPRNKPIWKLAYTSKNFDRFISRILPYLVLKKEKALIAIEMRKLLESTKCERNIPINEIEKRNNLVVLAKKYSQ